MSTVQAHTHGDHHEHAHHVTSMRLLTGILIVLLIMTAVTVFASRIDLGESLNLWLAIAIDVLPIVAHDGELLGLDLVGHDRQHG